MKTAKLTILALFASVILGTGAVYAQSTDAVEAWKAYAAATGNPEHQKWLEAISAPEAVQLAEEWKALRGYDVYSLLAKEKLPAELKPGLRITKDNVDQFPWLKDYLPATYIDQLKDTSWASIGEITVVPSSNYYMSKGTLEATKEAIAAGHKAHVNERGELLDETGKFWLLEDRTAYAVPFLHPKSGLEMNWTHIFHAVGTPNLFFRPIAIDVCKSDNSLERHYEADLWWQHFHGRRDIEPMGSIPGQEEVIEGGSIFFHEPNDIRGLAGARLRYASADQDDDFRVFIPGLRRTRLLSGSDAQDPIAAGTELTWDDWRAYWQKTDPNSFEYNVTGEGFILAVPETGHYYRGDKMAEDRCNVASVEVELRPVWILEVVDKTGRYQYSKRVIYMDKENYYQQHQVTYDPRGNLYRIWIDNRDFVPATGLAQWKSVLQWNYVSKRFNTLTMDAVWGEENRDGITAATFDVDQLRDYQ